MNGADASAKRTPALRARPWLSWGLGVILGLGWLWVMGWRAAPRAFAHAPRVQPACRLQPGRVVEATIPTEHLAPETHLRVRIYHPPCYDPTRPAYPVLILIHGQNFDATQWVRLGATDAADALIRQGLARPFLIVMPEEPRSLNWTLPPDNTFDRALVEDLLPWLEKRYPVASQRERWAIGGISRGAGWALRIGLQHWERFRAIGAHSPAVFWGDGSRIPRWLEAIPEGQWPAVSIDVADYDREEIRRGAQVLEDWLMHFAVPHRWRDNVGRHDEAYWRRQVPSYLRWYTTYIAAPEP